MKNAKTVLVIVLAMLAILLVAAGGMMGFGGMMGNYSGYGMIRGYGFNFPIAILSVVLCGFIIGSLVFGVLWFAGNIDRDKSVSGPSESLVDILKRRYAKGEITKEQFEAIKRDLAA